MLDFHTLEYRNDENDLMIIDWDRDRSGRLHFDINIFPDDIDDAYFTEINADMERLLQIIEEYGFLGSVIKGGKNG